MPDSTLAQTAPVPALDRKAVLLALANDDRWRVVAMLMDGRLMSVSQIATALDRKFDGVSKTLIVLNDAGVITAYHGQEDTRQILYGIPAAFRAQPGMLDFGFCRFNVS